jgi:UDP-N-acetylmuramate dehydrogenase
LINIEEIRKSYRGQIALNAPMSKYTSFCIGGPADYFFEPSDKNDAVIIIKYLQSQNYPFTILGKGTNVLVNDDGIHGAVINLEHGLNNLYVENGSVIADAGAHLTKLVDFCIQNGFSGVEMLAGIPGTVGGAIVMNAGAFGSEISTYLIEIETLRDGKIVMVQKENADFTYRRSDFARDIVLGASFRFPSGEKAELMEKRRELLLKRNQTQPLNFPNAGCMFKNPEGDRAARLIDQSGLKGLRRGNAQISEKHANFIVNTGGAKAQDVLELIKLARKTVIEKFDIKLELEVKLLGFSENIISTVNLW